MSDELAIRQVVKHIENAWNAFDSQAFATVFSADADFIHIVGGHFQGRGAIQSGHRQIWDTIYKGSRATYDIERIRFIRSDVAVAYVIQTLTVPEKDSLRRLQARPTLVLSRENGIWQVVTLQNTLIGDPRPFEEAAAGFSQQT